MDPVYAAIVRKSRGLEQPGFPELDYLTEEEEQTDVPEAPD